jgi:hypothetical protein
MTEPAAPAAAPGTPAAPAPGAAENAFAAPWSGKEGVYMIGEGDKAQPWWSGIKEEPIREYMKTKNYANPEEAARAAWSANKLLAERGDPTTITVPKGDATPEQWEEFYKKIGRPDSPDKYEFKHGEGVTVDKDLETLGRNIFHKLGVPGAKAQEAIDMWNAAVAEKLGKNAEEAKATNDAELDALSKSWGADLDKNRAAGERVMKALGLDAKFMEKIEGQIGSAAVVELLAKIGRKSDEGSFKGGNDNPPGDPNNPDTMSPEQAQAKINALNADTEFQKKYTDKNHAGHKDALILMEKLFAKATPKKP